jgi:hypothetical protein
MEPNNLKLVQCQTGVDGKKRISCECLKRNATVSKSKRRNQKTPHKTVTQLRPVNSVTIIKLKQNN